MGTDLNSIDWTRVEELDVLYISSVFDLSEWWDQVGRNAHATVFLAVLLVLPNPASNGYQERVFSACTYFDDKLQQNRGDDSFEMKVLLAVNKNLVDDYNLVNSVVRWV